MWWVSFSFIILLSMFMKLAIYDFSLPYIDHADEPGLYQAGQEWRGLFNFNGIFDGYPPAYIAVNVTVQQAAEWLGVTGVSNTVRILRLIASLVTSLTLVLIMLTARRIGGDVAGIVAGIVWIMAPIILQHSVYALADPFVYLFVALAMYLSAEALVDPKRRWWCILSVGTGLVATLFKYPAVPSVLPGVLVGMNSLFRHKQWRFVASQSLLIALVIGWLFFGYGLQRMHSSEANRAASQGIQYFLDFNNAMQTIYDAFTLVLATPTLLIILMGTLAYGLAMRADSFRVKVAPLGLVVLVIVLIPWVANTFNPPGSFRPKDVIPATGAICVLLGAAVAQILETTLPFLEKAINRSVRMPATALVIISIIVIGRPQIDNSLRLVADLRRPDRRIDLRQWADINLDPGTFVVNIDNHKTFNPYFSGLTGHKWFDWWVSDNFLEHSVAEWRDQRKMSYAALPIDELQAMQQTPAGQDALAQMLHLRDFVAPPDKRGPEVSVYRLWRFQTETQAEFGNVVRLIGYDGGQKTIAPGDILHLRFYWQPIQKPLINYSLFIHVLTSDQTLIAQADGSPTGLDRVTSSWNEPGETLIGTPFDVSIPANAAIGDYHIIVGLYDSATGIRLRLPSGDDAFQLFTVSIQ